MANKENQQTRKRKKLLVAGKLLASAYMIVFTAGYITSSTGAYFMDTDKEAHVIQAGAWWDGSELAFTGKPVKSSGEQCPNQAVTINLHNNGQTMIGSTDYEVYHSKEGDPKKGKVVKEGKVYALQAGEKNTLSYENAEEGSYIFKVKQRPGYDDENEESESLWSEKVIVACADTDEQAKEDKQKEEDKNKQETEGKNTAKEKQEASEGDKQTTEQKQQEAGLKEKTEDSANSESKTVDPDEKDTQVKPDKEMNTELEEETSTSGKTETKTSDKSNDSVTDTQSAAKK